MSEGLRLGRVLHDCDLPSMRHLPSYGERHQVLAHFRCPVCKARWRYAAYFMDFDRLRWERASSPSWRWSRAERRRLRKVAADG